MHELQRRATQRADIIRAIRGFFESRDFIEVDTPVALSTVAPEAHIDAPVVDIRSNTGVERRYLQTSPELPMKRLLAAGLPRIFQIAAVFRDGDHGPLHRPEFRLLEWYRRDDAWQALLSDCEGLLDLCAKITGRGRRFNYLGRPIDLTPPFKRVSVDEAFREHAGFSILDNLESDALRQRLADADIRTDPSDTWDDLFHRIFLTQVEPALVDNPCPVFLTHYPAPLASLARLCPNDPRMSERFELYVGGLELANGFGELTDADEQRRRFERHRKHRLDSGRSDYPLDERFLTALASLPPSAGIALGVERLLMILLNADTIDDVALIPWGET